jgi:hypothetical protein
VANGVGEETRALSLVSHIGQPYMMKTTLSLTALDS